MAAAPHLGAATVTRLLDESAPRKPNCFNAVADWHRWIVGAHVSGIRVIRRQDLGKWSGERRTRTVFAIKPFAFCDDCLPAHQACMQRAGRCDWVTHHLTGGVPTTA